MQFCVHLFSKEMGLTHLRGIHFQTSDTARTYWINAEEYYQQCVHNVLYEIEGFTTLTAEGESTSRNEVKDVNI